MFGVSIAQNFAIRALEKTEYGQRLIEDLEECNPRGEAILVSIQAFVRLALLYFSWRFLSPFVPNGGVAASSVNTFLFLWALLIFYIWAFLIALAGQREEAENPLGVEAILKWWKIASATLGAITLLVTVQQAVDLLF